MIQKLQQLEFEVAPASFVWTAAGFQYPTELDQVRLLWIYQAEEMEVSHTCEVVSEQFRNVVVHGNHHELSAFG